MSDRKKHRTIHEYLGYLKGALSNEERHDLERDLEADPFEKEAMEGFEMISSKELEEDLLSLHSRVRKRQQKRRRAAIYSIAATVASLLVVGTIFISIYDFNPEADQEAARTEESLLMEKSPEPSEGAAAEAPDQDKERAEEIDEEQAEELEVIEQPHAQRPDAEKNLDAQADKEEVLVPDRDLQLMVVEAAEEPAVEEFMMNELEVDHADIDAAVVAAPQMAREEAPEMAEEMAPAPEADAIMAVEAAPTRRQKKAMSKAKTAPSTLGQVNGVVLSAEDLDPLPGASVYVKGTSAGYVTDMEGRFSVPVGEQEPTTVVASYVGMITEEHQMASGQENRVVMQPDQTTLNEVVVVAYGAQNEKYPVSAVQKVQMEQEDYYSEYTGAEPIGGIEAYKMYMEKNIRFPAGDTLSKREVVVLKFTVEPDGSLSVIQILRSPGDAFTEEAIRLVEEGPRWNPAQSENGSTDDVVRMRIVFKL